MLRLDYRWIESDGRAYLHFRYGCVATVKRHCERFRTEINWRDLNADHASSMARGGASSSGGSGTGRAGQVARLAEAAPHLMRGCLFVMRKALLGFAILIWRIDGIRN
jgi:hypothetical protein